jgi:hypothetical protein
MLAKGELGTNMGDTVIVSREREWNIFANTNPPRETISIKRQSQGNIHPSNAQKKMER